MRRTTLPSVWPFSGSAGSRAPELAVSKLTAELPVEKPTVRDEPVVMVSTDDRSDADDDAERCVGSMGC